MRREIDGLNLALYDLSKLRGHLILVHGRSDPLVPYSESQALAAAASNARVSLFLVDDIGHVEFNAVTVANAWKMWQRRRRPARRAALEGRCWLPGMRGLSPANFPPPSKRLLRRDTGEVAR